MRGSWILLVACAGCAGGESQRFEWPEELSTAESILIVRENTLGYRLSAYALEDVPLPITGSSDDVIGLQLLGYDQTLDELFLEPGELRAGDDQSCAQAPLPGARVGFYFDTRSGKRSEASELPEPIRNASFEQSCPCLELDGGTTSSLGAYGSSRFVAALDGGGWAVVTKWAVIELDDRLDVVSTATVSVPEDWVTGAVRVQPDGAEERLLIVALQGFAYEWTRSGGLRTFPRAPNDAALAAATAAPDGSEVFALTFEGLVLRLDLANETWSEVWSEPRIGNSDQEDAMAWIAPGRVTMSQRRAEVLLELGFQGSSGFTKTDWTSSVDPVEQLEQVDGLGLLMASGSLNVWLRRDDASSWERLNNEGEGNSVGNFHPLEEGFLQSSSSTVRQFHPRSGYCRAYPSRFADAKGLDGSRTRGWLVSGAADPALTGETSATLFREVSR